VDRGKIYKGELGGRDLLRVGGEKVGGVASEEGCRGVVVKRFEGLVWER